MEVQMRSLDSEFHQDRALASGLVQQSALGARVSGGEVDEFRSIEVAQVFDMSLPDDHRMSGDAAVGMKEHGTSIVGEDHVTERREIRHRRAEAALH